MDGSTAGPAPKKAILLADYQPPAFLIETIDLVFDIRDRTCRVTAVSKIRRNGKGQGPLELDGGPYMTLASVALDGALLAKADYEVTTDKLVVRSVPESFELTVVTDLLPFENTRLEGLYASGGNLCTQCEAEGFRHITYFLDRPDVLARYSVRIEADKGAYPVLLSNGDETAGGDLGNGRHFSEWQDPYPKPCYLFALVAGQLTPVSDRFVTKSGRDVALNIFVREPDVDKCGYAMQSLKRAMEWDEEVFGLEYDLNTYNIVAVSDFNMGAMENKGLNIFNTKYVLASDATATDSDFDHVEGVIGHEYFHNWTGNRVTCRDWFQLSLKEGLTVYRDQEFSSDMTSRAVKRIEDVRVLRMLQFPEDAGPLSHPVRPESYIEINNFYTTTIYNKGAEVIRMMNRLLGDAAFRQGVALYLDRHDGQAATCEDFVVAMEDASGADLAQFRRWYAQAGTPTVTVRRQYDAEGCRLTVRQNCPPTPGQDEKAPFHMPIVLGWVDGDGGEFEPAVDGNARRIEEGYLLSITESEQEFYFKGATKGCVPSLLRGFSAPVKMNSDLGNDELAHLMRCDSDSFARWQAGQDLFASYLLSGLPVASVGSNAASNMGDVSHAFETVVSDEGLDPAFAAELIGLPGEIYLGQLQDTLDPEGTHRVRETLMRDLANEHFEILLRRFKMLKKAATGASQKAKGARKLRNQLLGYIVRCTNEVGTARQILMDHYDNAANMTDQLAALTLISHSVFEGREDKLEQFYDQWRDENLVIDKWFAVQAQNPGANAIESIRLLMGHPVFTLQNPNRLRSLVSTFSMLNQVRFHQADGAGYKLLSSVIADVDKINPQTAARMVAPLGRWARLDETRQKLMRASLGELAEQEELSDDVRELVEKSLN